MFRVLLVVFAIASANCAAAQSKPTSPTDPASEDPTQSAYLNPSPPLYAPLPARSAADSAGESAKVIRVSGGVMAQQVVSQVDPVYPPDLKARHVGGTVVLAATIGTNGSISDLSAVSGPPQLTEAASTAVRQWRYRPYLLNGTPVAVATTVTVHFQPEGDTQAGPAAKR